MWFRVGGLSVLHIRLDEVSGSMNVLLVQRKLPPVSNKIRFARTTCTVLSLSAYDDLCEKCWQKITSVSKLAKPIKEDSA